MSAIFLYTALLCGVVGASNTYQMRAQADTEYRQTFCPFDISVRLLRSCSFKLDLVGCSDKRS